MQDELPLYMRFPQLKKTFFGDDIARGTIARWERDKGFPRRIKVGANSVMWDTRLVKQWIEGRSK